VKSLVGGTFGKYEISRLLGKGGMGEVYEAYDTDKGRSVALKILAEQYADDEKFRTRFLRESRAAAILQEPHVIPIHDWGEIDHTLYIDMRLVQHRKIPSSSCDRSRTTIARSYPPNSLTAGSHNLVLSARALSTTASSGITP
jgi:serine/threonine protein kinase